MKFFYRLSTILVIVSTCFFSCQPPKATQIKPVLVALDRLKNNSDIDPEIRFENGIPKFIRLSLDLPISEPSNEVHRSLKFISDYKDLFNLTDPYSELFLDRVDKDSIQTSLFFAQKKDTIPVFGSYISIHLEEEEIVSLASNYSAELPNFTAPKLSLVQAENKVMSLLNENGISIAGISRLIILDPALLGQPNTMEDKPKLAWSVMVESTKDLKGYNFFIDAQSGEVLLQLDTRLEIDFSVRNGDGANAPGSTCSSLNETVVLQNESGVTADFDPSIPDVAAAVNAIRSTYNFFSSLGQLSYDNRDSEIKVIVNFDFCPGEDNQNGAFNFACNLLVFDPGMVTLDILAHEFSHGVTRHSSNLILSNQSGSLNESYSDVFGALVENRNWLIGENTVLGTFRDMSNPPTHNSTVPRREIAVDPCPPAAVTSCGTFTHPDHMDDLAIMDMNCDNGGVHINSGIPNKVAYLLGQGGTHNGVEIQRIGKIKLARLYYDVLRRLGNSADFMAARDATVEQARSYVRNGRYSFTNANVCSVQKAFSTVGLGTDCSYRISDRDGDYIDDDTDICPDIRNPRQVDRDGDGMGDACDLDIDDDGLINDDDSCPLVINQNIDLDDDGIDCACDDNDRDGYNNCSDNCLTISNRSQSDIDGDGLGDECDPDIDGDGILNVDDLCPLIENTGLDDDGDTVDDACDLCPGLNDLAYDPDGDGELGPLPILDNDGDGVGDPCDPDDDNDGICDALATTVNDSGELVFIIPDPSTPGLPPSGCLPGPNGVDNCPITSNRYQFDLDNNGKGLLCDFEENVILNGSRWNELQGFLKFADWKDFLRIPFNPCWADGPGCPDYLDPRYTSQLQMTLPFSQLINVKDHEGNIVGSFMAGPNGGSIGLPLDPGLHFVSQPNAPIFNGKQWFLEIARPANFHSQLPFSFALSVKNNFEPGD